MELQGLWTPRRRGSEAAIASAGTAEGSASAGSDAAEHLRPLGRRDTVPPLAEQSPVEVAAVGAPVGAGDAPGDGHSRPPSSESPDAGGRKRGAGDA
eukprot:4992199-Alexandrium_andersonii.AAC.1